MTQLEYKVVPAPTRGLKARGLKTPEARFANAMESLLNDMASEGWHYLRADTLPSEERQGLTGTQTGYRNLLVFSRPVIQDEQDTTPAPAATTPEPDTEEAANDGGSTDTLEAPEADAEAPERP